MKFINNWKYKGNFNKYIQFNRDFLNNKHLLIGIFNFYLFFTWR